MLEAREKGDTVQTENNILAIPIKIRDHVAGVIRLRKSSGDELRSPAPDRPPGGQSKVAWNKEEIAIIETLSDQLGVALESARLYEDTRRRAERERLTSEIISKVRSSNDPQVILQTAVSELRRALQASRAQVGLDSAGGKTQPMRGDEGES